MNRDNFINQVHVAFTTPRSTSQLKAIKMLEPIVRDIYGDLI